MMEWNMVRSFDFLSFHPLILAEEYRKHCQYFHPWVISLGAAAIICPYGTLLKFLATCHCVQGRSFYQTNCCGRGIKALVEYVGGKVLLIFIGKQQSFAMSCCSNSISSPFSSLVLPVINGLLFLIAMYYAYVVMRMYTVLYTFILSKLFSYVYWFGWTGPYFSYKYPIDQKIFYKEFRKQNRTPSQNSVNSENQNPDDEDDIEIPRLNSGSNLIS
jgi:hypothetical protein